MNIYSRVFRTAVELVLTHEGQRSYDEEGGDTRFGIARYVHPTEQPWPPTRERAIRLYYDHYWVPHRMEMLPDELAVQVFDVGINVGMTWSIKCLQRALRACGRAVNEDGSIGPQTMDAVNDVMARPELAMGLRCALKSELAGHYRLVAQSKAWAADDLHGWERRAYQEG